MSSDGELLGEGEGKTWKRFTIIPNVEGQKYTLGNNYIGREEQGEFIFWDIPKRKSGTTLWKHQLISVCQITIVNNEFWITALKENSVHVNDVNIRGRTQLNFGDYVILGDATRVRVNKKAEEWNLWSECYPTRFLFKQRELFNVESELLNATGSRKLVTTVLPAKRGRRSYKDEDTASAIGLNPLVLYKILSYLPVPILKGVRLVSKSWNEEARRLIKKSCAAHLLFGGHWEVDQADKSMKLFRYSVEVGNSLLQNWKMVLTVSSVGSVFNHFVKNREAKFVSDLDWFFKKSSYLIRSLELESRIDSGFSHKLLHRILEHLQSTLEDLSLSGEWKENNQLFPADSLLLNKLRRFTMSVEPPLSYPPNAIVSALFMSWFKSLIPAITSISSLLLNFRDDHTTSCILSKLDEYFPKLKEIGVKHTGTETANHLLQFKNPFAKLELNRLEIREAHVMGDVEIIEKLINSQAKSLESFQFFMPHVVTSVWITLPTMMNLKSLNIGLLGYCNVNPTRAKLALPGSKSQINYELHFPCLQSLTLWPWGGGERRIVGNICRFWTDNCQFFSMFFPDQIEGVPQQVCKTLRYLDVPWEDRCHRVFPRAEELATMYPNVSNKWANEARNPPGQNIRIPDPEIAESIHTMKLRCVRPSVRI